MRFFHTSDTHLGHQQYPRTGPDGLNVREADIAKAFHAVIDRAIAEEVDAFVHAGDLFDGVRPGNRALATALDGFVKLDRAGIPTILIAGNHEHPKMRETGSPFRLLDHLEHIHALYKGRAETVEVAGVRFHGIPQCASNEALAKEAEAIQTDGNDVLVLHGSVHNMDAFRHAEFNELTLDTRWFDGHDYVALGHYHGVHQVADNAWYCGAPERVSMSESGEDKGFLDVKLGQAPTFCALPGRPYMDLPVLDAAGMDAQSITDAASAALQRAPQGSVVRQRIDHVDVALRGVLDQSRIRSAAPDALHVDLRVAWHDPDHRVAGAPEFGGLDEEFEKFVASTPIEVDRERLLARARDVLSEAA